MTTPRLSPAMRNVLHSAIHLGQVPTRHPIKTEQTLQALRQRGLLDGSNQPTQAGREVFAPPAPRRPGIEKVVARVRAILRRQRHDPPTPSTGLVLDDDRLRASLSGCALELTAVEFRLLKTLAATPGRIYSRDKLLDQLYDDGRAVTDRAVDSHIKNLRRKLETACPDQTLIRSVYGAGYCYEPADTQPM